MTRQVTMDEAGLAAATAAERQELARLLAGLSPAAWDAASLCAGWRVRDVVAHIAMPLRYSAEQYGQELAESHGDFDQMADRCARRDAQETPTSELIQVVRDSGTFPWRAPGGMVGALNHVVIHGLDITVPLGIGRRVPEPSLRVVLDTMTRPGAPGYFGTGVSGVRLVADDLDWSWGTGSLVSGLAQDLAAVLCGRRLPAGRLRGAASGQFTAG
jgi:uncharacterized protein (TIGR03083 family)